MAVAWHPSLTSGNADIDQQHQEIIRRLADLVEALEAGRREEIGKMFEFLGDYVVEHFTAEERAMERTRYPGRNVHAAAHLRFVRQYAELRRLYEVVGPSFAIAVRTATWIEDWLKAHIYGADRALARHLREAGAEAD
jgi:hemerythrin